MNVEMLSSNLARSLAARARHDPVQESRTGFITPELTKCQFGMPEVLWR